MSRGREGALRVENLVFLIIAPIDGACNARQNDVSDAWKFVLDEKLLEFYDFDFDRSTDRSTDGSHRKHTDQTTTTANTRVDVDLFFSSNCASSSLGLDCMTVCLHTIEYFARIASQSVSRLNGNRHLKMRVMKIRNALAKIIVLVCTKGAYSSMVLRKGVGGHGLDLVVVV